MVALSVIGLCGLLALWGTPSTVSEAAFGAALRSGQVRAVSWDSHGRYGQELLVGMPVSDSSVNNATGPVVVWASRSGRLYRTDVSTLAGLSDPSLAPSDGAAAGEGSRVDVAQSITATAAAAGAPVPLVGSLGPYGWLGWPLVLLTSAGVLLLLAGTQPRRTTKWGLFWILGLPAGIGLAWWVLRDAPWDPRMGALPEPPPRVRGMFSSGVNRIGGGVSFLRVLVITVIVGLLGAGVVAVTRLGSRPEPAQGSVTWSVIWTSGAHGTLNE